MRLPLMMLAATLVICLASDWYILRRLRQSCHDRRWPITLHLVSSLLLYILLVVAVAMPKRGGSDEHLISVMWMLFAFFTFYIPKILFTLFDLLASIPLLWKKHRLRWLSVTGVCLSVAFFVAMWWGALGGRYATQVRETTVYVPGLPEQFEGYKLVQFSDFHVGTYGSDTTYVSRVVDRINSLDADVILFTGDIVNRRSSELIPFVAPLSRLSAPDGVYSILGNHDYGDYSDWPSPQAKAADRSQMLDLQKRMGWHLLLNETAMLRRGNDSIALIGVENIGDHPFPVYGSLSEAYPASLADSVSKILLTHNPAHWSMEIENNPEANVALTLSGHTHAMQIELLGLSPAVFRYPKWGGLYDDKSDRDKHLYVNIGLGTVAIPMRLGARPELSLITLTGHAPDGADRSSR